MKAAISNFIKITTPTLLILFCILEIGLRMTKNNINLLGITGIEKMENPMGSWALNHGYHSYTAKPGKFANGKTVNRYGFISTPELKLKKPKGMIRIAFLGGSSTAGTGVTLKDEETWPWKVATSLRKQTNKKIEFLNAALSGYTTFESYGRLWSRIRFFDPDIIVVYHGWNEMYYFTDDYEKKPLDFRENFTVNNIDNYQAQESKWVDKYIYWSQLLVRIRIKINRNTNGEFSSKESQVVLKSDFNPFGLSTFEGNLKLFKTFSKTFDTPIFIAKQASLISKNTLPEDKERCKYYFHEFNHDAHVKAFEEINKKIDTFFDPSDIIDCTSLSGTSNYFHDHIHQTNLGTSKIAEIVTDSLLSNFFLAQKD